VPLQQQNAKEPDPELDGAVIEPLDADQLLKVEISFFTRNLCFL
jgi:hypothetical protein